MRSTAMLCISTLDGARDHTPLDTQYLSHLRDEIGVVDSIEVVDMDPRYGISIPSVLQSTGGIVDSQEHYYATAACTA